MRTTTEELVGTDVPLPYLGENHHGIVVRRTWCESLGEVLRVREETQIGSTTLIVYGDHLIELLAELDNPTPVLADVA